MSLDALALWLEGPVLCRQKSLERRVNRVGSLVTWAMRRCPVRTHAARVIDQRGVEGYVTRKSIYTLHAMIDRTPAAARTTITHRNYRVGRR